MTNYHIRILTGWPSFFLDTMRILAALTVMYIHAHNMWFPAQTHDAAQPGEWSHASVIVFFVLSGYVIAHTTASNNRGGKQYAVARLTRLCSIVIPALLITAIIQYVVGNVNADMLGSYSRPHSGIRYALCGMFLNNVWFFSMSPPINGALWSLSFEFWYYAIFGLWLFRGKGFKGLLAPILACLIAGPQIITMMPIWLAGCIAYRLPRPILKPAVAWVLVIACVFCGGQVVLSVPPLPYIIGTTHLLYANQFITDWCTGFFFAMALWLLPQGVRAAYQPPFVGWYRKLADLTFPLYVLHYPLFILWGALFGFKNDIAQFVLAVCTVFAVALVAGHFLDKGRPVWQRFFNWLISLGSLKYIFNGRSFKARTSASAAYKK